MINSENEVILVTGATGFVGRHLLPALKRDGHKIRSAVRHKPETRDQVLVEPLGPNTSWNVALDRVGAVIHLAARVHHPNEDQAAKLYHAVNTEGTLRLARSAADAGVQRFIYVSTILVNGGSTDGRSPFRADDETAPRGVYGQSKADAEIGLRKIAQNSSMKVSVIRPPLVYGAGAGGNFRLLARALQLGVPLPFGCIENRRAFISVGNLISFIAHRLSGENNRFAVYLVADEDQISTPDFVGRLAVSMNRNAHIFPMPAKLLEVALRAIGRPELRDSLIGSMEVDVSSALSCGWRPPLNMAEGLKMAVAAL